MEDKEKIAEVNLLEKEEVPQQEDSLLHKVMATIGEKKSQSKVKRIDPGVQLRKKKSKTLDNNRDIVKSGTSCLQRNISLDDMLISRGQSEYFITEDLAMHTSLLNNWWLVLQR